jgi:predicted SAM-dependent methyltransferase
MMHVIEHVPDPDETLREIFRVLKPGGMLVMETPRYDTLMMKLFGRRERSLSCAGHIYFFTTKTLREVSEKAGFTVVREDKVGRSLTIGRLVTNVGIITRSTKLRDALMKTVRGIGLENVSMHFNARDMERIYLAKPA